MSDLRCSSYTRAKRFSMTSSSRILRLPSSAEVVTGAPASARRITVRTCASVRAPPRSSMIQDSIPATTRSVSFVSHDWISDWAVDGDRVLREAEMERNGVKSSIDGGRCRARSGKLGSVERMGEICGRVLDSDDGVLVGVSI